MPALICDACGAPLVSVQGGLMKCNYCGLLHSSERVAQKVQEIKGIVEITKGNAEKDRLVQNAEYFLEHDDIEAGKKVMVSLNMDYPQDACVQKLSIRYEVESCKKQLQREYMKFETPSSLQQYISIIIKAKQNGVDCTGLCENLIKYYDSFDGKCDSLTSSEWCDSETYRNYDEYGLCELWKLKISIVQISSSLASAESELKNLEAEYSRLLKSDQEHNKSVSIEKWVRRISAVLFLLNIWLAIKVTAWWALALVIIAPWSFVMLIAPLLSSNKTTYTYFDSASSYAEKISEKKTQIAEQKESLIINKGNLGVIEHHVSQRIRDCGHK
ncbi:MAG TPA: hypothetical protein DDX71_02160 [Ruminococcus sp.]|nr:hypothetical protein [Ruminococcus sp.]